MTHLMGAGALPEILAMRLPLALLAVGLFASPLLAQWAPVTDARGRAWNQPRFATNLTWHQIAAICPQDGRTPCSGSINGRDFTGYIWATNEQVRDMLSAYAPELATQSEVSGPAYTLNALMVLGSFQATQAFYSTYSNSEYVGGWTSTSFPDGSVGGAGAGASWPVYSAGIGVGVGPAPTSRATSYGVWLFRAPPCRIDMDANGTPGLNDVFTFLNAWFATEPRADFNAVDGLTTQDIFDYLNAWFAGC